MNFAIDDSASRQAKSAPIVRSRMVLFESAAFASANADSVWPGCIQTGVYSSGLGAGATGAGRE